MKNPVVWVYWENRPGEEKPAHIRFCHHVLANQSHTVEVRWVTPDNVYDYLPDLDPRVWNITLRSAQQNPIAVRCDFIRAFLLERYGGLYLDSDCLVLVDFAQVFKEVGDADFFAMRRTSAETQHVSVNFYGSRVGGHVITEYCDRLREKLAQGTEYGWAEAGAHLVTPVVNSNLEKCYLFREDRIHPVVAEEQHLLADENVAIEDVVPSDAITLMLFHRIFEQEVKGVTLKNWSPSTLAESDALLSRVYRQRISRFL